MFVDDVIIYSDTMEEHLEHLRLFFEKCKTYGITLKPSKMVLGATELEILGHVLHLVATTSGRFLGHAFLICGFNRENLDAFLRAAIEQTGAGRRRWGAVLCAALGEPGSSESESVPSSHADSGAFEGALSRVWSGATRVEPSDSRARFRLMDFHLKQVKFG